MCRGPLAQQRDPLFDLSRDVADLRRLFSGCCVFVCVRQIVSQLLSLIHFALEFALAFSETLALSNDCRLIAELREQEFVDVVVGGYCCLLLALDFV